MTRCSWAGSDPLYVAYHDREWGVPEYDSRALWEKLVLDGFQAGLAWITILRKREGFRDAFGGFDPAVIASWGPDEIDRLVQDARIIRHRGKIAATIDNAQAYLRISERQEFSAFLRSQIGPAPLQNHWSSMAEVPTQTPLSVQISKSLQREGFKFVGPTIVYAWMQATGMVNDHITTCPRHAACAGLTSA